MTRLPKDFEAQFVKAVERLERDAAGEDRRETPDPALTRICVRLVTWEVNAQGVHHIWDVKEQELHVPVEENGARAFNFACALKVVMLEVLARFDTATAMPADFFHWKTLDRKTFGTMAEFEAALRRSSRLGRYL